MLSLLLVGTLTVQASTKAEATTVAAAQTVEAAEDARFTDVYELRGGSFIQVAWQNTRIP